MRIDGDNSLTDALQQLISIQYQQLNAINDLAQNAKSSDMLSSNPMAGYAGYAPTYNNSAPNPFSSATNNMVNQYRNYAEKSSVNSFMDVFTVNTSKMSQENRQILAADYSSRLANTALAGSAAATGMFADWGASALAPGLAGSVLGAAAGSAATAAVNQSLGQGRQQGAYNKFLLQNSYRFINPSESNNDRNVAGFNNSERWEASTFLRKFGSENFITDEDTMGLLQNFTEGRLLKEVKDLKTFKERMSDLTKYTKEAALTLNSTFNDVSKMMGELEQAGINSANLPYLSAKGKIAGSITGMSATEAINNAFGATSNLVSGTNYDASSVMNSYFGVLSSMGSFYDREKSTSESTGVNTSSYNFISNVGGPEQSSKIANAALRNLLTSDNGSLLLSSMFSYDDKSGGFTYNEGGISNLLGDIQSKGYNQVRLDAQSKLRNLNDPLAQNQWFANAKNYINSLPMSNTELTQLSQSLIKSYFPQIGDLNTEQASLVLMNSGLFGNIDSGTASFLSQYLNYSTSQEGITAERNAERASFAQSVVSAYDAQEPGIPTRFKSWIESIKDVMYVPLQEGFQEVSQNISDFLKGGKTIDNRDLISSNVTGEQVKAAADRGVLDFLGIPGSRRDIGNLMDVYEDDAKRMSSKLEKYQAGKYDFSPAQRKAINDYLASTDPDTTLDETLFKNSGLVERMFISGLDDYKSSSTNLQQLRGYRGGKLALSLFGNELSRAMDMDDSKSDWLVDSFMKNSVYGQNAWDNATVDQAEKLTESLSNDLTNQLMRLAQNGTNLQKEAFLEAINNNQGYDKSTKQSFNDMFASLAGSENVDKTKATEMVNMIMRNYSSNISQDSQSSIDQSLLDLQKKNTQNSDTAIEKLDSIDKSLKDIASVAGKQGGNQGGLGPIWNYTPPTTNKGQ